MKNLQQLKNFLINEKIDHKSLKVFLWTGINIIILILEYFHKRTSLACLYLRKTIENSRIDLSQRTVERRVLCIAGVSHCGAQGATHYFIILYVYIPMRLWHNYFFTCFYQKQLILTFWPTSWFFYKYFCGHSEHNRSEYTIVRSFIISNINTLSDEYLIKMNANFLNF